jgi:hypothetical protein
MHRFWAHHIKPIVETLAPARIIEVGAFSGWNTQHLLRYCRQTRSRIEIIDPAPHPALHDLLAEYPEEHAYHPLTSLEALPLVRPADLVLIDGDHNWYTVYNELKLIFSRASETATPPPIVLLHDVAWPYARRDMYYDPLSLLDTDRHPYAYRGMLPGKAELTDAGMNGELANALHEGGPSNGVLTAVEDFIESSSLPMSFFKLPYFNGLGILVPDIRMTTPLRKVIDGFFSRDSLLEACIHLERDCMIARAELDALKVRDTQKTEALMRARALIAKLQHELAMRHGARDNPAA